MRVFILLWFAIPGYTVDGRKRGVRKRLGSILRFLDLWIIFSIQRRLGSSLLMSVVICSLLPFRMSVESPRHYPPYGIKLTGRNTNCHETRDLEMLSPLLHDPVLASRQSPNLSPPHLSIPPTQQPPPAPPPPIQPRQRKTRKPKSSPKKQTKRPTKNPPETLSPKKRNPKNPPIQE